MLLAEFLRIRRDLSEVAPRQAGKQVVLHLELQPPMEPVHPGRAQDVDRPHRLLLEPIVPSRRPNVDTRREVVQTELDMLDSGDREVRGDEHRPLGPVGQRRDEQRIPNPKDGAPHDLLPSAGHLLLRKQEQRRLRE